VVALGDVRGPAGGLRVRRAGGRQIAVELVQWPRTAPGEFEGEMLVRRLRASEAG